MNAGMIPESTPTVTEATMPMTIRPAKHHRHPCSGFFILYLQSIASCSFDVLDLFFPSATPDDIFVSWMMCTAVVHLVRADTVELKCVA